MDYSKYVNSQRSFYTDIEMVSSITGYLCGVSDKLTQVIKNQLGGVNSAVVLVCLKDIVNHVVNKASFMFSTGDQALNSDMGVLIKSIVTQYLTQNDLQKELMVECTDYLATGTTNVLTNKQALLGFNNEYILKELVCGLLGLLFGVQKSLTNIHETVFLELENAGTNCNPNLLSAMQNSGFIFNNNKIKRNLLNLSLVCTILSEPVCGEMVKIGGRSISGMNFFDGSADFSLIYKVFLSALGLNSIYSNDNILSENISNNFCNVIADSVFTY